MNKSLNIFLWVLFFSLMAPSGMVLASWNAVPGDTTYSWKTNLESVLLAVLPSNKLKSATHSKLTERRMGEVSEVLSGTHAREGLNNLNAQVLTTKDSLSKINNPQDRAVAVALYIQTLNEVNNQLETEKQSRSVTDYNKTSQTTSSSPPTRLAPLSTTQPTPILQPAVVQPTQEPIAIQPTALAEPREESINEEVTVEIDQTQEQITNVIHELEDIITEAEDEADTAAKGKQEKYQEETKQKNENKGKKQGENQEESEE